METHLEIKEGKGYCKVCGNTARFEVRLANTQFRPVCGEHKEMLALQVAQGNSRIAETLLR